MEVEWSEVIPEAYSRADFESKARGYPKGFFLVSKTLLFSGYKLQTLLSLVYIGILQPSDSA